MGSFKVREIGSNLEDLFDKYEDLERRVLDSVIVILLV